MLIEQKFNTLIDQINSSSPAPGGGSVSAMVGALGSALVGMFIHLSTSKKKFMEADEQQKSDFLQKQAKVETAISEMMKWVDEDTNVYNSVINAYKLPKNSDEEKILRQQAINKAMTNAIESPLNIMKSGVSLLTNINNMVSLGNKNAVSDYIVGVLLIHSAIIGAGYNVRINLSAFDDETRNHYQNQMNDLIQLADNMKFLLIESAEDYL